MPFHYLNENKTHYVFESPSGHTQIVIDKVTVFAVGGHVLLFGVNIGKVANFGAVLLAVYLAKTDEERINAVVTRITQEGE